MNEKKGTNSFVWHMQEVNKLYSAPNENEYACYHLYFNAILLLSFSPFRWDSCRETLALATQSPMGSDKSLLHIPNYALFWVSKHGVRSSFTRRPDAALVQKIKQYLSALWSGYCHVGSRVRCQKSCCGKGWVVITWRYFKVKFPAEIKQGNATISAYIYSEKNNQEMWEV